MNKLNKKGFTLAELLIVVAIIAVLVVIAIPVFGTALSKAQLAADAATVRANLAEAIVNGMADDNYFEGDGSIAVPQTALKANVKYSTVENETPAVAGTSQGVITVTHTKDTSLDAIEIPYDDNVSITTT